MSQSCAPPGPDLLLPVAQLANLLLSPERLARLVPVMDVTRQLLDALDQGELGETAPATSFDAAWSA